MNFIQLPKILLPELDFLNNILNCLYFAKYRAIDSFSVYFQIKALLKKKKGFHFLLFYSVSGQEIVLLNYLFCGKTQFVGRSVQFSSVALSCPTLCDPMDCSTPGFPVYHHLLELTQIHVYWVSDAISPSVVPFSSCLQSFPASGSFLTSRLFASGGQIIGASASASVLSMNIQDWFPLGLTGLILQSKGLSRVFSNTTVPKH